MLSDGTLIEHKTWTFQMALSYVHQKSLIKDSDVRSNLTRVDHLMFRFPEASNIEGLIKNTLHSSTVQWQISPELFTPV